MNGEMIFFAVMFVIISSMLTFRCYMQYVSEHPERFGATTTATIKRKAHYSYKRCQEPFGIFPDRDWHYIFVDIEGKEREILVNQKFFGRVREKTIITIHYLRLFGKYWYCSKCT